MKLLEPDVFRSFPGKIMNGIKLKPQSQKDNIEKELEFEIIQKLNNRGINFIQNLKMFNGTFKVDFNPKKC